MSVQQNCEKDFDRLESEQSATRESLQDHLIECAKEKAQLYAQVSGLREELHLSFMYQKWIAWALAALIVIDLFGIDSFLRGFFESLT